MKITDETNAIKHTPTPWRIGRNGTDYCVFAGEDGLVADCDTSDDACGNKTDIANAAFIVRACNSHQALVDALKDLRGRFLLVCENAGHSSKHALAAMAQADTALKLAEPDQ